MTDRQRHSAPGLDAGSFERLEALVRELVERHRRLAAEHARLREGVKERDARIRTLDSQLVELNQKRKDAAKRIEELIEQIAGVEAELEQRLDRVVRVE
jgi:chromosome segregation ATPase